MKHFLIQATEYTNLNPYYTPKNILKMTAKEKADQLVEEFKYILTTDNQCHTDIDNNARKCALLTTKHVLLNIKKYNQDLEITANFDYWFEIYNLLR